MRVGSRWKVKEPSYTSKDRWVCEVLNADDPENILLKRESDGFQFSTNFQYLRFNSVPMGTYKESGTAVQGVSKSWIESEDKKRV